MKTAIHRLFITTLCIIASMNVYLAQNNDSLQLKLKKIVENKKALVCVSIMDENGETVASLNEDIRCTLHSVFKFHIALTMLSEIDKGHFSLNQLIEIKKSELLPDLYSPLREEHPNGGVFPISMLMEYTVSLSDNVACDVLLRLLGGPRFVEKYIKKNGVKKISIRHNEEEINLNNALMYFNWTTAKAANNTLIKFYKNKREILSQVSHSFIWTAMKKTETGANRLKGQLPEGTVVAHKTGSSGTDDEGLTVATNDIGIIFLPNGSFFYITVFVTQSKESEEINERIIADIARAAWDHFNTALR